MHNYPRNNYYCTSHLGLLGCNIVLMKRFLPLLILTGLLFGQDVLHLKSGESYKGTFYGKVGEDIVFKVEGETSTKFFTVNYVDSIQTKNGELIYPSDIPNKTSIAQDEQLMNQILGVDYNSFSLPEINFLNLNSIFYCCLIFGLLFLAMADGAGM